MTTSPTPVLLAVDGNSLAHRAFHALAASNLRTHDGRPSWAVKGFISQLLSIVERVGPQAIVVGFDDHTGSVRRAAYSGYKATRKPKPPELGEQIAALIEVLRAAGVHVVVPAGLEADDVLASAAATATAAGWRCVITTSDRDSFALITDTTSVLRILTGGVEGSPVLTPDRLHTMYKVRPEQYKLFAAIRGDSSDNLPGVTGVGEVTAAKILAGIADADELFADLDAGGSRLAGLAGKAAVGKFAANRDNLVRNLDIMTMRTDVPLALDLGRPSAGWLPVAAGPLAGALDSYELTSVAGRAAQLLAGADTATAAGTTSAGSAPMPLWDDLTPAAAAATPARPARPVVSVAAEPTRAAMPGSTMPQPALWPVTL